MNKMTDIQHLSIGETFYYHSDHLGSAAYLTYHGGVVQTLNYLPYGEDWVEYNFFHPDDTTRLSIYRFNGKEKDYESGFHYYGARYYWSEVLTGWLSVDPQTDELPFVSSYGYCNDNPVVLKDPDGEFPLLSNIVGAADSVLVEYGGQVVTNLVGGQSLSKALTDVDYTDLGIAAVEGFVTSGTNIIKNATVKTTVKIGSSIVKNTVDEKKDGVTVNDAKSVATQTVLDLAGLDKSKGMKIPSPKTTTANKAVNAAKTKAAASGKSISGVQAKQIAQKTRSSNTDKKIVHKTVQKEYQTTPGKTGAAIGKGVVNRATNKD